MDRRSPVFLQNGKAIFEKPGIYIFGLCLPFAMLTGAEFWRGANWITNLGLPIEDPQKLR